VGFLPAYHQAEVVVDFGMVEALAALEASAVDLSTGGDGSFLPGPGVGNLSWVKTLTLAEHGHWKLLAARIVSEHLLMMV